MGRVRKESCPLKGVIRLEANETASFEQLYKYPFPDRTLVNSREWESLCRKAKVDKLTGISVTDGRYNGYNKVYVEDSIGRQIKSE